MTVPVLPQPAGDRVKERTMEEKKDLFDHLPNYVCNNTQVVFARNQLENMQISTAVLHLYAEPGQKKKVHCGTFLFWISKESKKKKSEESLYSPRP